MNTFISVQDKNGKEKYSGTGNATLYVAAEPHTGRNPRTTTLRVFAPSINKEIVRTIKQDGIAEFLKWDNISYTIGKEGGTITLSGESNAAGLSFINPEDTPNYLDPQDFQYYKIEGVADSINNGGDVPGQGLAASYRFYLTLNVTPNGTTNPQNFNIRVDSKSSQLYHYTTLKLSAGDAFLLVNGNGDNWGDEIINIAADGKTKALLNIESNLAWEITEI